MSNLEVHTVEMTIQIRFCLKRIAALFTSIRDALMLKSNVFGEMAFQTKAFRALSTSKRFQFQMNRRKVLTQIPTRHKL